MAANHYPGREVVNDEIRRQMIYEDEESQEAVDDPPWTMKENVVVVGLARGTGGRRGRPRGRPRGGGCGRGRGYHQYPRDEVDGRATPPPPPPPRPRRPPPQTQPPAPKLKFCNESPNLRKSMPPPLPPKSNKDEAHISRILRERGQHFGLLFEKVWVQ